MNMKTMFYLKFHNVQFANVVLIKCQFFGTDNKNKENI